MNRQQRRAEGLRSEKLYRKRMNNPELDEAYHRGFDAGFKRAAEFSWRMCFAAVAKTLRGLTGFGQDDIVYFLRQVDEVMTLELSSEEIVDEVLEETGLLLNFDGAFSGDRIEGVKS